MEEKWRPPFGWEETNVKHVHRKQGKVNSVRGSEMTGSGGVASRSLIQSSSRLTAILFTPHFRRMKEEKIGRMTQ